MKACEHKKSDLEIRLHLAKFPKDPIGFELRQVCRNCQAVTDSYLVEADSTDIAVVLRKLHREIHDRNFYEAAEKRIVWSRDITESKMEL